MWRIRSKSVAPTTNWQLPWEKRSDSDTPNWGSQSSSTPRTGTGSSSSQSALSNRNDPFSGILQAFNDSVDDESETFTFRPLVYVAAPYSIPDPVLNTHDAIVACDALAMDGWVTPVCPHLNMAWHTVKPHRNQFWLDYDLALLQVCDALLRLPGISAGADAEVEWAMENDIPVFFNVLDLYAWVGSANDEDESLVYDWADDEDGEDE